MLPVLFKWRGLRVWSYPAMLYFGLLFGVVAGNIAAHAAHLDAFRVYVATLILIVPSLAGARLLYVAANWKTYKHDPRRIWDRQDGGLIMYGGLPAMLLLSLPLLSALQLNFGAFWDVSSFTILVGMMFTRVGCLLNGCCAGCSSKAWFSLYLPNRKGVWEKRVPTQILEAVWAVVLLVSAIVIWPRVPFRGGLFLFVAGGYACARLVMEPAREREADAPRLSVAHVVSIITVLLSVSTLTIYW
jgi:phosphatidylglycerol:prolipoprotein diacylglycerol transferase